MSAPGQPSLTRRVVLRGAAAGGAALPVLAACADGGETDAGTADPGGPGGGVATSDVPVGGGVVLPEAGMVVTQPSDGEFRAFTATCTHQACAVTGVQDGAIVCPCHGSRFAVEDGTVLTGPATQPLEEIPVTVEDGRVQRA